MEPIKLLLVGGHAASLKDLKEMIGLHPDLLVVGEVQTEAEALETAADMEPDVVLLDITLSQWDGISAARAILEQNPLVRVIVLAKQAQEELIIPAIQAGVRGYLLKDASGEELAAAIHTVERGEAAVDSRVAAHLLDQVRCWNGPTPTHDPGLTRAELEILSLVAAGASNREIGTRLSISEKTVRNRLSIIFQKLQVKNRTQAALIALKQGFIVRAGLSPGRPSARPGQRAKLGQR